MTTSHIYNKYEEVTMGLNPEKNQKILDDITDIKKMIKIYMKDQKPGGGGPSYCNCGNVNVNGGSKPCKCGDSRAFLS